MNRHHLGFRIAQIVALSSAIGIAACQDATSPDAKPAPEAPASPIGPLAARSPLSLLGASLGDATDMFVAGMKNEVNRIELQRSLKDLSTHLVANKIDLARNDIVSARALLATADEVETSELGAIDVALVQIETVLDAATK